MCWLPSGLHILTQHGCKFHTPGPTLTAEKWRRRPTAMTPWRPWRTFWFGEALESNPWVKERWQWELGAGSRSIMAGSVWFRRDCFRRLYVLKVPDCSSIWNVLATVLEVLKTFRFGFLWVPEGPGMFQAVLEVWKVVEGCGSVWQILEGTPVLSNGMPPRCWGYHPSLFVSERNS